MEAIIALVALTVMEIVLGIDNIIFIAILTDRLPADQQPSARTLGLGAALVTRILLLLTLTWVMGLTAPLFSLPEQWFSGGDPDRLKEIREVSWRDIILLTGGLFLIGKSVREIHEGFENVSEHKAPKNVSFAGVLVQIALLDVIFSLDSVITAVGMVEPDQVWVMITAIIVAIIVMMLFAKTVSGFISRHPALKVLALSFLIMIGVMLVAEGIGTHINKGYIYFAMAFAMAVEGINILSGNRPAEAADPATGQEG